MYQSERETGRASRGKHLGKVMLKFLHHYFNVLIYAVNPAFPVRLASKKGREGGAGLGVGITFAATEID